MRSVYPTTPGLNYGQMTPNKRGPSVQPPRRPGAALYSSPAQSALPVSCETENPRRESFGQLAQP